MDKKSCRFLTVVQVLLVASCTTIGPTVQVSPPAGKVLTVFAEDRSACMESTDAALQPVATRMNLSATSTADVAAGNASIQAMYNDRFGQCMTARGNVVVASAGQPAPPPGSDPSPGPVTTGTQEATDPVSIEAQRALAPLIGKMRHDCDGEDIVAGVRNADVSADGTSRLVALTEPHGGNCFGQPGENDYLVERRSGGWALLLAAEPGSISVLPTGRDGHADLEMHGLGLCVYRYGWNGSNYAVTGAQDCALPAPPSIGTLPGLIRP